MELGQRRLYSAREVDVEAPVELGRQPGLDADLGGAQVPRLAGAPHDLLDRQEVALLLAVVARERAEAAVLDAHVGEVDVAVHDIGDGVADVAPAQLVGGQRQRLQIPAGRPGQDVGLGHRDLEAVERPREDPADVA